MKTYLYCLITMFLLNNANAHYQPILHNCEKINNYKTCIDNFNCMWCNNSKIINNSIVHINKCKYLSPCNINSYYDCEYKNKSKYDLQCTIGSILFYLLLFVGYYVSIIVIYGTLNNLFVGENISENAKKSINTLILIVMTVPLCVLFFLDDLVFNFVFVAYIITAMFVTCCIKVKKINVNTKTGYNTIN